MTQDKKAPKLRFKGFTDDWEHQSFFDLATFNKGKGYTKRDITSIGTPIFLYGSLYTQYQEIISNIKTFTAHKISNAVISSGDEVVLPDSGETADDISRAAYINKSGIILGGGLLVVHPDKTLLNPAYLAYSLTYGTNHKLLSSRAQGKSIVHIHLADLEKLKIRFPEVNEQIKIAKILNLFNQTIKTQQRKLDQLKLLKKGLLQKMFADEESKVPEIRFKGFDGEWEQRKLGDVTNRITRKNKNLQTKRPLTISAQLGLIDQHEYFGKQIASTQLEHYIVLKKGEFAYNKSYSTDYPYGAIKRLNRYSSGALSTLYIAFIPTEVNTNYLDNYFSSSKWYKEIYKRATEGARNHGLLNISPVDFFEMNFKVPQKSEQQKIGYLLNKILDLEATQQKKLTQLQQLKKFLLQNMFI